MATVKFNTKFITISSDVEAPNTNFKCFIKWMPESYIKDALSANPTLYLDILEQFWGTATVEVVSLESAITSYIIYCKIQNKEITITTEDMNQARGLQQEAYDILATNAELEEFFDFIHYSDVINLGKLNKKNLRKEWSYVFATLLQVFTARKSSFDQISAPAQ